MEDINPCFVEEVMVKHVKYSKSVIFTEIPIVEEHLDQALEFVMTTDDAASDVDMCQRLRDDKMGILSIDAAADYNNEMKKNTAVVTLTGLAQCLAAKLRQDIDNGVIDFFGQDVKAWLDLPIDGRYQSVFC